MFKKLKTVIKFRVPVWLIISLISFLIKAFKDKVLDDEEKEKLWKKIKKLIMSIVKIKE